MNRRWLGAMLATFGCGTREAGREVAESSIAAAATLHAEHATQPSGLVAQDAALAVLTNDGYARSAPLREGFLAMGANSVLPVTLPAGRCTAFASRASVGVQDLDGVLYLPDGTVLAEDEGVDAEPVVTYCTGEAAVSAYLVLRAYRGAGAFLVSEWSRPRRNGDPVLAARVADDGVLRELTLALTRRGFHREGPVREVDVPGDGRLVVPLPVEAATCYAVLSELDTAPCQLRLLDDAAHELARGGHSHRLASLQHCAEVAGAWAVELRVPNGARGVKLWVYRGTEEDVGGPRALWLGEPVPTRGQTAAAPAPVAAGGLRIALSQGHLTELPLRVARGCQKARITLEPGLLRATVRIETARGVLVEEQQVAAEGAEVHWCANEPLVAVLVGQAGFGALRIEL